MTTSGQRRVVIVGGGVIGLSIAWRLAERGHPTLVLERGTPGCEASGVAGGMLTLAGEADPHSALLVPLRQRSAASYPDAIRALERASGHDVGFAMRPSLEVAFSAYEFDSLRELLGDCVHQNLPARAIDAAQVQAIEPAVSPRIAGGLLFPDDGLVNPRLLVAALAAAAQNCGAELRSKCHVERLWVGERGIEGAQANGETIPADCVVLAAGAWSGSIAGLPAEALPPVRPVRGQILSLAATTATSALLPSHVVRSAQGYIIPHTDGRFAVGATSEEMGFAKDVTVEGVLSLLRAAYEMVPGIAELAVRASECGLRPASRDGLPVLGPSTVPGLLHATGHHRSGIMLWNATAEALVDWIEGREPCAAAQTLTLDRFFDAPTRA